MENQGDLFSFFSFVQNFVISNTCLLCSFSLSFLFRICLLFLLLLCPTLLWSVFRKFAPLAACRYWQSGKSSFSGVYKTKTGSCGLGHCSPRRWFNVTRCSKRLHRNDTFCTQWSLTVC